MSHNLDMLQFIRSIPANVSPEDKLLLVKAKERQMNGKDTAEDRALLRDFERRNSK